MGILLHTSLQLVSNDKVCCKLESANPMGWLELFESLLAKSFLPPSLTSAALQGDFNFYASYLASSNFLLETRLETEPLSSLAWERSYSNSDFSVISSSFYLALRPAIQVLLSTTSSMASIFFIKSAFSSRVKYSRNGSLESLALLWADLRRYLAGRLGGWLGGWLLGRLTGGEAG